MRQEAPNPKALGANWSLRQMVAQRAITITCHERENVIQRLGGENRIRPVQRAAEVTCRYLLTEQPSIKCALYTYLVYPLLLIPSALQ